MIWGQEVEKFYFQQAFVIILKNVLEFSTYIRFIKHLVPSKIRLNNWFLIFKSKLMLLIK